jgi:hypothetical protein
MTYQYLIFEFILSQLRRNCSKSSLFCFALSRCSSCKITSISVYLSAVCLVYLSQTQSMYRLESCGNNPQNFVLPIWNRSKFNLSNPNTCPFNTDVSLRQVLQYLCIYMSIDSYFNNAVNKSNISYWKPLIEIIHMKLNKGKSMSKQTP